MTEPQAVQAFDILIIGGGMVGLTLACELAGTGLRLGLMDANEFVATSIPFASEKAAFDARVSAVSPASRGQLEQVGAWSGIESRRYCPYTDMQVWDADGTGSIHFAAADIHEPALGYIVENSIIQASLHERLAVLGIEQIVPARVQALRRQSGEQSGIDVTTEDGRTFHTTLLVGADGPRSKIRELAGFATREWDYQHQAIVTTVRTEFPHHGTALQRFTDAGPLAFLPLSPMPGESDQQHYCSIVWSQLTATAGELMTLDDAAFALALQQGIEHRLGDVQWVDSRAAFPLRQRHAVDYVQPGIALVGDAAHTIHPLAGQGVNLGFLDVKVLGAEISRNLARGRPLDELAMLNRYQRQRIGHNLGMMWLMEGFKFLFADQPLPLRWLRNAGMSGLDKTSMAKNLFMRQAIGNGVR